MSIDRALLAAYLRQRAELGEREVFLDSLDRGEAVRLLAGAATTTGTARDRLSAALGSGPPEAEGRRHAKAQAQAQAHAHGPPAVPPPVPIPHPDPHPDPHRVPLVREPTPDSAALNLLREQALACTRCGLSTTRTQVVFGDGTLEAEVMVVGEAPGADEDRMGIPFVGKAGRMLDLLLQSIGLPRERVYICNVLKCRPPQNRDPAADEVAKCAPYLQRQIALVRPRALLAVGRFAAQSLTGSDAPMARLRGRVHEYEGVPVVATYHPAYLLRSPDQVRRCWQDLQLLRSVVDGRAS